MPAIKTRPTSAGRRSKVKVTRDQLHSGGAYAPLQQPQLQKAGRNHHRRIISRAYY